MRTTSRLGLAALAVTLVAAGATARADTVTGTFRYLDSGGVLRPIASAKVEIWRFASRGIFWGWDRDATVTIAASGNLAVNMPFAGAGVVYAVRVFATNAAVQVWPNDALHTVPFYSEPGMPGAVVNKKVTGPGQTVDFSFDFTDSFATQHYNIAETVRRGFDYANARRDPGEVDAIGQAQFQPTTLTITSWYNPVADSVNIHSSQVFEDLVILHEYAHYLEAHISSFAWIPSSHTGCTASVGNSAEHAWMEGFADYFAQSVNTETPPGTLSGTSGVGTPSRTTLEASLACIGVGFTGDKIEIRVASTLWDLYDRPTDPGSTSEIADQLSRQDRAIFEIFDRELGSLGHWPTVTDFHEAWVNRGLDHVALDRLFVRHAIPEPPGVFVPGYDADGRADIAVWRPSNGTWFIINSSTGSAVQTQWGLNGDVPVPADYDGDGRTDVAVYRPTSGSWFLIPTSQRGKTTLTQWGLGADIPVPADYNGDGRADIAFYRPSTGQWFIQQSLGASITRQLGGVLGDEPQPADYDGDGKADLAVFRASTHEWRISQSTTNTTVTQLWGDPDDFAVAADYNGDGRAEPAVARPTSWDWWIPGSGPVQWGQGFDLPAPADYDGDGRTDIAIWRQATGDWYVRGSNGSNTVRQWGLIGDIPVGHL